MPSPNADRRFLRPFRAASPASFQSRLTYAFVGVVALTLALVSPVVINRFDDYFRDQETQNLKIRQVATYAILASFIDYRTGGRSPVVADADGGWMLDPAVRRLLESGLLATIANNVAQADIAVEVGPLGPGV